MQRLRHGPEIRLDAGGERSRQPQRDGDALWRQPHDLTARRGGAEHAKSRRRVPSFLVVVQMHAAADARLGLKAGDEGSDECASVNLPGVRQREQRRQQSARTDAHPLSCSRRHSPAHATPCR